MYDVALPVRGVSMDTHVLALDVFHSKPCVVIISLPEVVTAFRVAVVSVICVAELVITVCGIRRVDRVCVMP